MLTRQSKHAESIRYYRAAVAIRPRATAEYHSLAMALMAPSKERTLEKVTDKCPISGERW